MMKYVGIISCLILSLFAFDDAQAQRLRLCMKTSSGKVIAKRRCNARETVLDAAAFNALVSSQDGQDGSQGPQGQQGAVGPMGPVGPQGANGLPGVAGPQGPQGMKGDRGEQGPRGLQGAQGPKGDRGATGATGPKGDKGATGSKGATGARGPQGLSGVSGYEIIQRDFKLGPNLIMGQSIMCPRGKVPVSGGAIPHTHWRKTVVRTSYITYDSNADLAGWHSVFTHSAEKSVTFRAYAICINAL